ncbi:MAG: serine/threonine protein kinase [Muribaculaceae bacterium]|nr:serine/threonine protein kinase [Muribaculaceae bacterium]
MIALNIGSTLQNGKYTIEKVLGQGGFGITYLVRHEYLGTLFAIKEFFPQDYCNRDGDTSHITVATMTHTDLVAQLRNRFLSEARNIAALNHPGIVKIHDVFEENGTAYFVMDFIDGQTLDSLVAERGALPERKAVSLTVKIAEALSFIHQRKMAHYDVKPANIIIRKSDGAPVLIDFGLSKQFNDNGDARSKLLIGVSHGFSPLEQYYEDGITGFSPKTDVYALAATLYYLLTARVPPEAPRLGGRTIEVPVNISKSVADTIKWAMTTDLQHRCPDMSSLTIGLNGNKTQLAKESSYNADTLNRISPPPPSPSRKPVVEDAYDSHYHQETETIISQEQRKRHMPVWLIVLLSIIGTILVLTVILVCLPDSSNSTTYSDAAEEMTDEEASELFASEEEVIEIPANAMDFTGTIDGNEISLWLEITDNGIADKDVTGEYRYSSNPGNVFHISGVQEPNGLIRWDAVDNSGKAVERVRCYINSGQLDGQCYDLVNKSEITSIKATLR